MATRPIPASGLSLLGAPSKSVKGDGDKSTISESGILLKLNDQVLRDLQRTAQDGKVLRLVTGRSPVCIHYQPEQLLISPGHID